MGWSVALFVLWILFAQSLHWQSVLTGLVVAVIVTAVNDDLLVSLATDLHLSRKSLGEWLVFVALLLLDIVKAGWQVAKLAFSMRLSLQPGFILHTPKLIEPLMRVILANSITLTPGTLTVEAPHEGDFVVHRLTTEAGEGLKDWHIENRLAGIEGMR